MASFGRLLFKRYSAVSVTRPITTMALTSGTLFGVGDGLAQNLEKVKKYDWKRTCQMVGYGFIIFGPAATKWFGFLQRRIVLKNKNAEILARVAADQLVFAPVNLTVFLSSMAYMDGQDPKEKLMESWLPIYKANLCVWPIIQFINFKFVPLPMRVLVVNVISIGWNCYLSMQANAAEKPGTKAREVIKTT